MAGALAGVAAGAVAGAAGAEAAASQPLAMPVPKVSHDWYQTETQVRGSVNGDHDGSQDDLVLMFPIHLAPRLLSRFVSRT